MIPNLYSTDKTADSLIRDRVRQALTKISIEHQLGYGMVDHANDIVDALGKALGRSPLIVLLTKAPTPDQLPPPVPSNRVEWASMSYTLKALWKRIVCMVRWR